MDRSLRRIEQVRALSDEDQRLPHLLELIGQPAAPTAEEKEQARGARRVGRTFRLGRLLLVTRLLAPSRPWWDDPHCPSQSQLARLADPQAANAALSTGDPQDLRAALGDLTGTICTRLSAPCLTRFG